MIAEAFGKHAVALIAVQIVGTGRTMPVHVDPDPDSIIGLRIDCPDITLKHESDACVPDLCGVGGCRGVPDRNNNLFGYKISGAIGVVVGWGNAPTTLWAGIPFPRCRSILDEDWSVPTRIFLSSMCPFIASRRTGLMSLSL